MIRDPLVELVSQEEGVKTEKTENRGQWENRAVRVNRDPAGLQDHQEERDVAERTEGRVPPEKLVNLDQLGKRVLEELLGCRDFVVSREIGEIKAKREKKGIPDVEEMWGTRANPEILVEMEEPVCAVREEGLAALGNQDELVERVLEERQAGKGQRDCPG